MQQTHTKHSQQKHETSHICADFCKRSHFLRPFATATDAPAHSPAVGDALHPERGRPKSSLRPPPFPSAQRTGDQTPTVGAQCPCNGETRSASHSGSLLRASALESNLWGQKGFNYCIAEAFLLPLTFPPRGLASRVGLRARHSDKCNVFPDGNWVSTASVQGLLAFV